MSPIGGPSGSGNNPLGGILDMAGKAKDLKGSSDSKEGAEAPPEEGASSGPGAGAAAGIAGQFVSSGVGAMGSTKGNLETASTQGANQLGQVNADIAGSAADSDPPSDKAKATSGAIPDSTQQ